MSDTDDFFREGERLALDWIAGESESLEGLAALVVGMKEFGAVERAFLTTIGNAARVAAKREGQPPSVVADAAPVPRSAPAAQSPRSILRILQAAPGARERCEIC